MCIDTKKSEPIADFSSVSRQSAVVQGARSVFINYLPSGTIKFLQLANSNRSGIMYKFKYTISAISFLLFIVAEISAEVSSSFRSQHLSGQKKFGYSSRSLENGRFFYTLCDTTDVQRKCKVVQEDIFSGDVTHSCDIVLRIEGKGLEFGLFLELAFGKDKAILIWEEKQGLEQSHKVYVRFTTIQFNNCQVGEAKLPDYNEALVRESIHHQLYIGQKIIKRGNKYDVFFEDRVKCGKHECLLSVDDQGRIINTSLPFSGSLLDTSINFYRPYQPTFVSNSPYHIRMIKVISKKPSEIFACLKMNRNEALLTLIRPGVSEKVAVIISSEESNILDYSVEHERVGICISSKNDSTITCAQYDVEGDPISEVYLPDIEAHLSTVYIIPDGGFLLLALKFEYCQPSDGNCDKHPVAVEYRIIKVGANGGTKELSLQGFRKSRIGQYAEFIYKNPNGEGYCVTVVYGNYVVKSKYMDGTVEDRNIVTNCFTEADFTE